MRRTHLILVSGTLLVLALAGCKPNEPTPKTASSAPLLLSPEDVHTIRSNALTSGPAITGSIQPERKADVRAEVPAIVVSVLKENGETVKRGDLLVRLDATTLRDALASAEASARASMQAFEQAQRQFERMKMLKSSGMISTQGLEDSEIRRNNLQSDLEAAKVRVVLAQQQMQRTEVRAPFDGVVSERKVSPGDTAQVGKELVKVIDPTSMRFEALVSADYVGAIKAGQTVHFRVNGYGDQEFAGKIRRVNPAANPTTRQVELLVDFVGPRQPKLAGLYAEGNVETEVRASLTIPASALVRDGDKSLAWRVADGKLQKVPLTIAERDARTGEYALKAGLAEGDQVIRYPSALLKDNQPVQATASAGAPGPGAPLKAELPANPQR